MALDIEGFPGGLLAKNLSAMRETHAGGTGLIPGLGRSPTEGNGNSLEYSCPENPKYRRAW